MRRSRNLRRLIRCTTWVCKSKSSNFQIVSSVFEVFLSHKQWTNNIFLIKSWSYIFFWWTNGASIKECQRKGHTLCTQVAYREHHSTNIKRHIQKNSLKKLYTDKAIIEKLSNSNQVWDRSNSDLMKYSFSFWYGGSSSLKILSLCSFHIHQNKQREAMLQTILLFLSNPLNFHLRRGFLTKVGNTHFRSKIAKSNVHSTLLLTTYQDVIRWFFTIFPNATFVDYCLSPLY